MDTRIEVSILFYNWRETANQSDELVHALMKTGFGF
jgi:hypothetical protein